LYETLRKGKNLNISTVWQVANSKLDLVYVVQENMTNWTSLKHQLNGQSELFTESTVAMIATELLNALDHLHSNLKIAHFAVDLNHVLCDGQIPDKYGSHFKLVDFDNARFFGSKKLP